MLFFLFLFVIWSDKYTVTNILKFFFNKNVAQCLKTYGAP